MSLHGLGFERCRAIGLCCTHRSYRAPAPRTRPARALSFDTKPDVAELGSARQHLAEQMAELERLLPTFSCSQLASTVSSIAFTYKAAHLSCHAGDQSVAGSLGSEIIEFYTSEFPDQSWLLTFRAALAQHLAQHPAALSPSSAQASSNLAAKPAVPAVLRMCSSGHSSCSPEHLSKILGALAGLPVMVVQPLPIGFGTPRWHRPLAAADPAAWESWLGDVAAVYAAEMQHQLEGPQEKQAADRAAEQRSQAWLAWLAQQQPRQQTPVAEQLGDFIINLACAMRWANVNVNDDRLQTQDFRQKVLEALQEQQEQPQQQQQADSVSWEGDLEGLQQQQHGRNTSNSSSSSSEESSQAAREPQQQHQNIVPALIAGSLAHRLTYTMLLLLLPPPRPLLAAFFETTAPQVAELFSISQLISLVRGLLFLGAAPPEPWLRALVEVVRAHAQELPAKDVQCFVEGFRFFGTKATKAGYLRDATAQLEEFTLC